MPDETKTAGATPVATGATPAQTAAPQTEPDASATEYPAGLGDAGKQALDRMKAAAKEAEARAKKAEHELEAIRAATQSESEKAIAAARKEGATEAAAKADARVRRSEVRRMLAAAGCVDVDIAARADDFAGLPVSEDGDVEGLPKAVEAFKAAHASLFATRSVGSPDAGTGGRSAAVATFTREQLRDSRFFQEHAAEIEQAMLAGRITG